MSLDFKIIIFLLQSLDGFIAKTMGDDLSWGSPQDKEHFRSRAKEIGVILIGSSTYIHTPPEFFEGKFTLVLTSRPADFEDKKNTLFFNGTPAEAVKKLIGLGYTEAALVGGGKVNNAFLKAGLVTDIEATLAPKIFGDGIKGYGQENIDITLELVSSAPLGEEELLSKYKVKR